MSTDAENRQQQPGDVAVTPTEAGPAADPALLAEGNSAHAEQVGLNMTLEAMQTYGRELAARQRRLQDVLTGGRSERSSRSEPAQKSEQRGQIGNRAAAMLAAAIDTSNIAIPVKNVTESYILSAFALAAVSVGMLVGRFVLSSPITLFVQPIGAALIAGLLIPAATIYRLADGKMTYTQSLALLGQLGALQGVLLGAATSGLELPGEPFFFLSPVVASFAITATSNNERRSAIAMSVGSSMAAHGLVGLLGGSLSVSYLTLSTIYSAALALPIQIEARRELGSNIGLNTSLLVGLTVGSSALVYALAGI